LVYSQGSGNLFYNANGATAGLGEGAQFATVSGSPVLRAVDFLLVNSASDILVPPDISPPDVVGGLL
jgi:hypothetical protein